MLIGQNTQVRTLVQPGPPDLPDRTGGLRTGAGPAAAPPAPAPFYRCKCLNVLL